MLKTITTLCVFITVLSWSSMGYGKLHVQSVNATAYCRGLRCAWGDKPTVGIIAVSRDLERRGLDYGTIVYVLGDAYVVKDRMPWQRNHIDIYMHSRRKAKKFGKKRVKIFWHSKRRSAHKGRRRFHK